MYSDAHASSVLCVCVCVCVCMCVCTLCTSPSSRTLLSVFFVVNEIGVVCGERVTANVDGSALGTVILNGQSTRFEKKMMRVMKRWKGDALVNASVSDENVIVNGNDEKVVNVIVNDEAENDVGKVRVAQNVNVNASGDSDDEAVRSDAAVRVRARGGVYRARGSVYRARGSVYRVRDATDAQANVSRNDGHCDGDHPERVSVSAVCESAAVTHEKNVRSTPASESESVCCPLRRWCRGVAAHASPPYVRGLVARPLTPLPRQSLQPPRRLTWTLAMHLHLPQLQQWTTTRHPRTQQQH
jgi:hypothetical protein